MLSNFLIKKNDVVLGYHIDNKHFKDEIEKEFNSICQKEGIENTQFIVEKKVSGLSIGKQISKFVNETNGTDVDFVIMGNNPGKHPQLQECPLGEVLNNALMLLVLHHLHLIQITHIFPLLAPQHNANFVVF